MVIQIIIADDDELVRYALRLFINSCNEFRLLGEATTGLEAVELCRQFQPNVALIDISMPEMDGITAIPLICEVSPATQIIALSNFRDSDTIRATIRAGAISYWVKNLSLSELEDAIRKAYEGLSTLAPEAAQALIKLSPSGFQGFNLTEREQEVLVLLTNGLTNQDIAAELSISISTVKKHVRNILTKTKTRNRTELTKLAMQQQIVPATVNHESTK